jgi:hypothetical protein
VIAPPWLWVPFDFLAEILPITIRDVHTVRYELTPTTDETVDPGRVVERARELRGRLESGERTTIKATTNKASTTLPATREKRK